MKSIAELAGKRLRRPLPPKIEHEWPLQETLMGIEVEAEAYPDVVMPDSLSMWSIKSDGSLQNGKEFVLSSPMYGQNLRTAISELMQGSTFVRSLTGSTHIHMDMLEENDNTEILRVLVMMIYVLEPMLYAAGDRGREWCGFANKLMTGPDELLSFVMDDNISTGDFRRAYSRNSSEFGRYYGMNLAALIDYGSLEFRYFPTATKEEELISWVELVQTFKKAARDIGNLSNLDNIIENESSFREFLSTYFGKWSYLFEALGSHSLLRNNYRKAHITSNLKTPNIGKVPFVARKVFATDTYKRLLKYPPSTTATAYEVFKLEPTTAAVPTAIPAAESGRILVYQGRIYFVPAKGSALLASYSPHTWTDIRYVEIYSLSQDPDLIEALWDLLLSGEIVITNSYVDVINNLPRPGNINPTRSYSDNTDSSSDPTVSEADDYDNDDYDSEMEDE
jgi:hypothetical protein